MVNLKLIIGNNSSNNENDVDEFTKKSSFQNDFYTSSIGEATSSFLFKGKKLINNIPKPFVKQFDRNKETNINDIYNLSPNKSSTINTIQIKQSIKNNRQANCRKFLHLASKGDRENFLESLEM